MGLIRALSLTLTLSLSLNLGWPLTLAWASEGHWDLWTCYQAALKQDPVLKSAEATRWANRAIMREKQALLLPNVEATVSTSANRASQLSPHYNAPAYSLTLIQPLIAFSSWADARYGRHLDEQAALSYASAEQDLIFRVAEAYFDLLKTLDALEAAQSERVAFERYLDQGQQRFKAGLIAVTDVDIAKARRDNAKAVEIAARNAIEDQRGVLQALVDQAVCRIAPLKSELPLVEPSPNKEVEWTCQALKENYDLNLARLSLTLARDTLRKNDFEHIPTVSVGATLNKQPFVGGGPMIRATQASASLSLTIPIYAGGGTQAMAEESRFWYRKSASDLERQHRETERLTQQYFRGIYSQIAQVGALKQAVASNRVALKATQASFEAGTRTIVDVLNGESDLARSQKDYKAANYDYVLQGLRLKRMAASLCPEDLKAINAWLRP